MTRPRAPVARHPNPQLERVPDHRHIADLTLGGIAIPAGDAAAWAAPGTIDNQLATHAAVSPAIAASMIRISARRCLAPLSSGESNMIVSGVDL